MIPDILILQVEKVRVHVQNLEKKIEKDRKKVEKYMDSVDYYSVNEEYSDQDDSLEKKLDMNSQGKPQWKEHMVHGKQRELHEMKNRFLCRESESFVCKECKKKQKLRGNLSYDTKIKQRQITANPAIFSNDLGYSQDVTMKQKPEELPVSPSIKRELMKRTQSWYA